MRVPDVYLFTSQRDVAITASLRDSYQKACRELGWNFQPRTLKPFKTPAGRPILPIATSDAVGLYPRSHRARVATLVFGTDPVVPLRPNPAEAIRYKDAVPLRQYLDYKSCWIRVPNDPTSRGRVCFKAGATVWNARTSMTRAACLFIFSRAMGRDCTMRT